MTLMNMVISLYWLFWLQQQNERNLIFEKSIFPFLIIFECLKAKIRSLCFFFHYIYVILFLWHFITLPFLSISIFFSLNIVCLFKYIDVTFIMPICRIFLSCDKRCDSSTSVSSSLCLTCFSLFWDKHCDRCSSV